MNYNPFIKTKKINRVKIEKKEVNAESVLNFNIEKNSGLAIHFQKK